MRRPAADRGSASTEVVLLVPVLLFLVMTVVQFGLWYHAQHVVNAAAQEGVEAVRAYRGSGADGERRAHDFLMSASPALADDAVITSERRGDVATVVVDGESAQLLFGMSVHVHAKASSPVERFHEDDREP